MSDSKNVARIIELADGEIIGRVRLQKMLFLLAEKGLGNIDSSTFTYHHYGPYSSALAAETEEAKSDNLVDEKFKNRSSDGARYSVFKFVGEPTITPASGDEQIIISRLKSESSTVLELAATARWLFQHEKVDDWRAEIKKRKGVKTENGRLDKAIALLREIDLSPSPA